MSECTRHRDTFFVHLSLGSTLLLHFLVLYSLLSRPNLEFSAISRHLSTTIFLAAIQSVQPAEVNSCFTHTLPGHFWPLSPINPSWGNVPCRYTHFTWTFLDPLSHQPILRQCTMSLHTLYLDIFGPSLQSTHPEAMYHVVTHTLPGHFWPLSPINLSWGNVPCRYTLYLDIFGPSLSSTHPEAMYHVVTHTLPGHFGHLYLYPWPLSPPGPTQRGVLCLYTHLTCTF